MNRNLHRRNFLKTSITAGVGAPLLSRFNASAAPAPKAPGASAAALPKLSTGKIGSLESTRIMLGTNIITHHMHSRGLRYVTDLSKKYNTDEKVLETFVEAERCGLTTFMTHYEERIVKIFQEYQKRFQGKMQWFVAPSPKESKSVEDFQALVSRLVEYGVQAIYVHGATADPLVQTGKGATLAKFVEIIKAAGKPAGVAAHDLEVIKYCESSKLPCDFYVKTFHSLNYPGAPRPEEMTKVFDEAPPGYWCKDPDETAKFMEGVTKPWIAYKVMAAGAIPPREAFRYAFGRGADFILAGMFDWQIAEDVKLAEEAYGRSKSRPRPWRA